MIICLGREMIGSRNALKWLDRENRLGSRIPSRLFIRSFSSSSTMHHEFKQPPAFGFRTDTCFSFLRGCRPPLHGEYDLFFLNRSRFLYSISIRSYNSFLIIRLDCRSFFINHFRLFIGSLIAPINHSLFF